MKKLIMSVSVLYCFLGCISVFSYDIFFGEIDPARYAVLENVCDIDASKFVCDDAYQELVDIIEPKIDAIAGLLIHSDEFWQGRILHDIAKYVALLEEKEVMFTGERNKFFMQYVRFMLYDILSAHQEVKTTLRVDGNRIIELRSKSTTPREFSVLLRRELIGGLMDAGYTNFMTDPYVEGNSALTTHEEYWEAYTVNEEIYFRDKIDNLVYDLARDEELESIEISPQERATRGEVYLFKNQKDLEGLGYHVISHRTRINDDVEYRRENIARAFTHIGNVRVLNPGQTLSYLHDIDFDPEEEQNYLEGKVIALDQEVDEYGGGLCGGSTAMYQGMFLNTALDIVSRNHSKRYSGLYTSVINGKEQSIPGIDSTIYSPYLDLKITNTRSYPIVLVMNYNGSYEGREEIFTLSPNKNDRGTFYHTASEARTTTLRQKDGGTKVGKGGCYTRFIHGKEEQRCYKEVF